VQFQVPQFIETESKIVGPFTLRQFIYVVIGGGLCFLVLYIFNFFFAVIFIGIIGTATATLAFIKVNGRPIASILTSAISYYWNPRLYLWQKQTLKQTEPSIKIPPTQHVDPSAIRQKLALGSNLRNLWDKITASRARLPKRETMPPQRTGREKVEVIGLSTGEREAAKRIDYK